jgi:hypothetical protein
MTNAFENTKEPRFPNAYIFDTEKNMFTRGADVHTYGFYGGTGEIGGGGGGGGEGGGGISVPAGFGSVVTSSIPALEGAFSYASSNIGTITVFNARCWAFNSMVGGYNNFDPLGDDRTIKIINVETGNQVLSISVPDNGGTDEGYRRDFTPFILGGVLYITVINYNYVPAGTPDDVYNSNLYKLNSSLAWELVESGVLNPNKWINASTSNLEYTNYNINNIVNNAWWGVKYTGWTESSPANREYNGWTGVKLFKLNSNGTTQTFTTPALPVEIITILGFSVSGTHLYQYYHTIASSSANTPQVAIYDISSGSPSLVYNGAAGLVNKSWNVAQMTTGIVSIPDYTGNSTTSSFLFRRTSYSAGSPQYVDYSSITVGHTALPSVDSYLDWFNMPLYNFNGYQNVPGYSLDPDKAGGALVLVPFNRTPNVASADEYKTRIFRLKPDLTVDSTYIDGIVQSSGFDPVTKRLWMLVKRGSTTVLNFSDIKYMTVGA